MLLSSALAVAKFLVHIPTWIIVVYLAVAAIMTVALLTQFMRNARTRNAPGNAWLILLILFFPLAALSVIWPITAPFAVYALARSGKQKPVSRGFPVISTRP